MARFTFAKNLMSGWGDDVLKAAKKAGGKLTDDGIEFASKTKFKSFASANNINRTTGEIIVDAASKNTEKAPIVNPTIIKNNKDPYNMTGYWGDRLKDIEIDEPVIKKRTNGKDPYNMSGYWDQRGKEAVVNNVNPKINPNTLEDTADRVYKEAIEMNSRPTLNSILESPIMQTDYNAMHIDNLSNMPIPKEATVPKLKETNSGPTINNAKLEAAQEKAKQFKSAASRGRKQNEMNRKINNGVKMAVGTAVTGALVFNMFDSGGQQSNAQLYNQGY